MADGAVFDPTTARWLITIARQIEKSQVLNPGYLERVVLKVMPRLQGGAASIKYAYPPSGGIPAATYNSAARKLTPGTASCRLAELVNGEYCDTGVYVVVENPVGTIVGSSGKPITVGLTSYGKWTVLVEDCSGESAPVEPTAMTPDPGESSGSRALDPGYKIGV
jgi:hypothetical protein